jgi:hypothetical protein
MKNWNQILIIGSAFMLCLWLLPANLQAQLFGPPIKYSYYLMDGPSDIFSADFDGDGHVGIEVVNRLNHTACYFEQNLDGTFQMRTYFEHGGMLTGITGADFNEDGLTDIAMSDGGYNKVYVELKENTFYNWTFGDSLNCPGQPEDIFAADLDGDGHQDLITANFLNNDISIFWGLGNGTFTLAQNFSVGNGPIKVIAGQFDNQPDKEIVVACNQTDSISVLHYQPYRAFAGPFYSNVHARARGIQAGNFNDDGFQDLIVTTTSFPVYILINSGNGTFPNYNTMAWGADKHPWAAYLKDFNGDGYDDVVVTDYSVNGGNLLLAIRDGDHFNQSTIYNVATGAREMFAADFNNDSYLDLAISGFYADSISIMYNTTQAPCAYTTGDVNNSHSYNGLDITYGVSYLKGGPPPMFTCICSSHGAWFVSGDVNASCSYNGLDVTYGVTYLKGGPAPHPCADCPPAP